MKITETTCVSDELYRLLKEVVGQSVSLGDLCIKRVRTLKHAKR